MFDARASQSASFCQFLRLLSSQPARFVLVSRPLNNRDGIKVRVETPRKKIDHVLSGTAEDSLA